MAPYNTRKQDILNHLHAGKRIDGGAITVMGLGNFGGGSGVTRWLCSLGAKVTVTDASPADKLGDSLAEIADLVQNGNVILHLGGHDLLDFTQCDAVVANPAIPVPWKNPYLLAAMDAGVPTTTEIRLVTSLIPTHATVVGITGSAGKSTTSAMISHMLSAKLGSNRVLFGGNIGGTLLPNLHQDVRAVVLELSSAMLYWLGQDIGYAGASGFSPDIGLVTNLRDNHADWHGSFEHYATSKMQMFRYRCEQSSQPMLCYTCESSDAMRGRFALAGKKAREVGSFAADASMLSVAKSSLHLPGKHNIDNAIAAAMISHAALSLTEPSQQIMLEDLLRSLSEFTGLPHRLQLAANHHGVKYYNDSKSTTPDSCLLAIDAILNEVEPDRIHLIAGGYDKKSDLTPVVKASVHLAGLYTLGATGKALADTASVSGAKHAEYCDTLDRAMVNIKQRVRPGDVVLLSPACASWGQFKNYEERGKLFCSLAAAY